MNVHEGIEIKPRGRAVVRSARAKALRIAELYNDGHDAPQIIELTGYPRGTVYWHLRQMRRSAVDV